MSELVARKCAGRVCVALSAALLAGCSFPAMLGSEHSDVRGIVSYNGSSSRDDYSALYQKGKAHFAGGQFGLAANEFQAALVGKPDSVEILNALGATYDHLSRFDLADRYYKDALALDPKDPQTLNNLAYSLMLRGDPQHAIPLLNVAQSASSPDPMIAANLALAKRLEKKLDQPAAADAGSSEKEPSLAPRQEAATQPAKPLYIERRSEEVQELVFATGSAAKTPAREWNLGSAALVIPLPPAPKSAEKSASNEPLAAAVHVIPTSYHSAFSKDDSDNPVASPLIPVSRSQVAELKSTPGMASAANGEPRQTAEPSAGPSVRLVETAATEPTMGVVRQTADTAAARPVRLVETVRAEPTKGAKKQISEMSASPPVPFVTTASAEPTMEAKKRTAETSGSPFRLIATASAEPTTETTNASSPPDHARSVAAEIAMVPAATLPTSTSRKAALEAPESPRHSSACSVEISNGAGKAGMASRFRTFAKAHGFDVRRLTNDRTFSNARTIAYYKPGFEERARKLAALLSVPVSREPASAGRCEVRLRLGHDLVRFYQALQHRGPAQAKS